MVQQRVRRVLAASLLAITGAVAATSGGAQAADGSMIITGVIDGPLSGGLPKAIEVYVQSDIADLSAFGLGAANNGGGTDGEEFSFPAGSASAGTYLYVASEAVGFEDFFGFVPDHTSGAASINGDDAIELFEDGVAVDVFGDPAGANTGWDYTDGWAKRADVTYPPTAPFDASQWTFSGPNALDGAETNDVPAGFALGRVVMEPPVEAYINEVRINKTGDNADFFEIVGEPGTSLDGLAYVVLSGEFAPGQVDVAISLDGFSIPADGVFVAGGASTAAAYGITLDLAVELDFFGSPSTHLLVDDFTGVAGADYDADDDGVLETPPWAGVIDGVSFVDGDSAPDISYGGATVGPDGSFAPAGTYRCPDAPEGGFDDNQLDFGTANGTPGESNDSLCTLPITFVGEVQGIGPEVAIDGVVAVDAIVVGDYQGDGQLDGFFVQEEDVDAATEANAATSDGIFVYCGGCTVEVDVGDRVRVQGSTSDFFGMSQISSYDDDVSVLSSGNPLPTPAVIDLPTGSSEVESTYEAVEGMLAEFVDTLYVSEYFELARYGQLVLTADARPAQFTDANEPSVSGYATFLDDLEAKRIILDDDNNIQNDAISVGPDEPYYWPRSGLSTTNFVRGGDSIDGLVGVMHWSFAGQSGTDAWRIRPVEQAFEYNFTSNNARTEAPDDVGGALRVASFNVLNYFTTLDSRGADSTAELDRQREKIAAAICAMDADVIGLMEIENNGTTAINDLLEGLNGVNSQCGGYVAVDTDGPIGTDEIAVAFIYRTADVSTSGSHAVLDSSVDSRFLDEQNRPALAQTFELDSTGAAVTVVVNHLKSKGSSCATIGDPDAIDGQGNCNLTRTAAAAALVDWLATDPTGSGDADALIIGDLNSYRNEDPIDAIEEGADDTAGTDDDYTDLLDSLIGPSAYTYVFDGQLGYLDHALANQALVDQVTGVTVWHVNADEIPVFDYNDAVDDGSAEASFERESAALPIYEPNAYRASDHDPVIVGLDLNALPVCSGVVPSVDRLLKPNHRFVPIDLSGATDADGDELAYTIDAIYSDEPVDAEDDGATAPDAYGLGTSTAHVRAERDGGGNGRVYHIVYTVSDGAGGSCSGEALVAVPVGNRSTAIDDGALFDATVDPG